MAELMVRRASLTGVLVPRVDTGETLNARTHNMHAKRASHDCADKAVTGEASHK